MGTLNLGTLGTLHLSCSEGGDLSSILSQPKRFALLVYLALAEPRGYHRRDSLLTLFWPEMDANHARNSLSQSLSFLRRKLPEGLVLSRGTEEVGLDHERISTGVDALEKAVAERRWADALDLYTGEFLKGFHLSETLEFDEWMEGERDRLRELAAGAAWAMAQDQIQRGELVAAERTAQRALKLVWSDETPVREFMRALAGAGDRAAALNLYERFCSKLREELDLEPSVATVATADAIRNGDLLEAEAGLASSPSRPTADEPSTLPEEGDRSRHAVGEIRSTVLEAPVAEDPRGAVFPPEPPARGHRHWVPWALVGGFLVALAGTAILGPWNRPADLGPVPFQRQLTFRGDVGLAALSPDGRMLAYVAGGEPRKLFVKDLIGDAELVVADSIGLAYELRWAPIGDQLAFAGIHGGVDGTFLFPRLGGGERRLGLSRQLAWGPRSERIALWSEDADKPLLIQSIRTGRVDSIPLPGSDQFVGGGDWSPQGDRLAVLTHSGPGPTHLWVLDVESGTHSLLFTSDRAFQGPRWSAGGDALYLSSYFSSGTLFKLELEPGSAGYGDPDARRGDGEGGLPWVTNFGPVRGRPGTSGNHNLYSISADGRRLAYTRAKAHSNFSVIRPLGGGRSEHMVLTRGTAAKYGPSLSPDGASLAFVQEKPQGFDLLVVSTAGGEPVRLNVPGLVAGEPDWAPDSRRLAIPTMIDEVVNLVVVSTGGEDPVLHPDARPVVSSRTSWAPGSLIAYQVPGNRNSRLLDPDVGGEGQVLVPNDSVGWMFFPRFSPDGTSVAVYWNRIFPGPGLWLISLLDGSQTRLAPPIDGEHPVDWSLDGGRIYTVGREGTIRTYSVDGGQASIVSQPSGVGDARCEPHERPDGLYWVCTNTEVLSDVWMIENFDPGRG